MSSSNITISINSSKKPPSFARNVSFPLTIQASPEETVGHVKRKIQAKIPKFHPSRQRLTLKLTGNTKPLSLSEETKLQDALAGLAPGSSNLELEVKDLGPQLGWKTVFVVEYFFELSNLLTHLHLRSLRPSGTKKRAIPTGYGFGLVSCPNYLFETLGWGVVCAMTGSWAAYLFTTVGTGQMLLWALKKHAAYKKEFGKAYPRGRKSMIPFLI
ncbi:hypothetical protein HHX47_DHR7000317 [Lentinula edodes]|nr:hypothetical protein HHX47_DHR7000317 [Lentinula edodes]